jgi:hypothetical protein
MAGTIKITHAATTAEGPDAVEVFRLVALISALRLEQKGIRLSRRVSALAVAKRTTGLPTHNRDRQIAALEGVLECHRQRVEYINLKGLSHT